MASEWGWSEIDVNGTVWHHVLEYYRLAVQAKARRLSDELMVARGGGEHLKAFLDRLERMEGIVPKPPEPEEDPRLVEARQIENWIGLKRASGQDLGPKDRQAESRASYLRMIVKLGLKDG